MIFNYLNPFYGLQLLLIPNINPSTKTYSIWVEDTSDIFGGEITPIISSNGTTKITLIESNTRVHYQLETKIGSNPIKNLIPKCYVMEKIVLNISRPRQFSNTIKNLLPKCYKVYSKNISSFRSKTPLILFYKSY